MTGSASDRSMFEIIKSRTGDLTKSEKRVARAVLAEYPAAGLQTVAELAKSSNVSGQTVIRFVASLGFENYPAFQARLIEELKTRSASPESRYEDHRDILDQDDILGLCRSEFTKAIADTFHRLPASEFHEAVAMLCQKRNPLVATGGRSTSLLAQYLIFQLQQMRPGTAFVPSSRVERANALLDMKAKTTVLIYDFRRYSDSTLKFAEAAHEAGAQIILITDPYLSPISRLARIVLPVQVDFVTPFESQLSGMAVTETLIAAVANELDARVASRIKAFDKFRKDL